MRISYSVRLPTIYGIGELGALDALQVDAGGLYVQEGGSGVGDNRWNIVLPAGVHFGEFYFDLEDLAGKQTLFGNSEIFGSISYSLFFESMPAMDGQFAHAVTEHGVDHVVDEAGWIRRPICKLAPDNP